MSRTLAAYKKARQPEVVSGDDEGEPENGLK